MKIQFGETAVFRDLEPGDVFTMPEGRDSVLLKFLKGDDSDPFDAVDLKSGMRIAVPPCLDVVVYRKGMLTL